MLGPVPADEFEDDGCTSVVEVRTGEDFDVGYSNLFYFFQNRHAFSTIATNDPENPEDILTIPESVAAGGWVPLADRADGATSGKLEISWANAGVASWQIRFESGTVEPLGTAPVPEGTDQVTDIVHNPYTGSTWFYATDCMGTNVVGEVVMRTASFLPKAQIVGPTCMLAGAILPGGMYGLGLDVEQDRFWKFGLYGDYPATPLGPPGSIGYSPGFMQDMDTSVLLGRPLIAGVHTLRSEVDLRTSSCGRVGAPEGQLRSVDLDENGEPTGSTTLIGQISANGGAQAMYYTFPIPPVVSTDPHAELPQTFELSAVYPNPIAPESVLLLELASQEHVTVRVFDNLGRQVAVLHDGMLAAGIPHRLALDTPRLASGLYLFHVRGESFTATRKAVIQR